MKNPYENLPAQAFWRSAVAEKDVHEISALWDPKRDFSRHERIATFGSCFAQHFSRALTVQGYNWYDAEPPAAELGTEAARERNYGIFSARTGNIYTAAALRQWIEWALAMRPPPEEVWESGGRYFDPFRPTIEPAGFSSPEELFASRNVTLRALREVIARADHFVFTLGLTEAWINRDARHVYAMCPGTGAGEFDGAKHAFRNFNHSEILADMRAVVDALRSVNERIGVLLTVSPVPLTATASGEHVLTATTYSKSVLRSVAGELAGSTPCVDYFASYEIITGTPSRARFYAPNLRAVTPVGVQFVMRTFFACLSRKFGVPVQSEQPAAPVRPEAARPAAGGNAGKPRSKVAEDDDVVCEEEMLAAFAPGSQPGQPAAPGAGATRMCVIGNSHIAALQVALQRGLFADPGLDIVFWGCSRPEFEKVRIEDGILIPPDRKHALKVSGGRYETIDPRGFDVLVFVGGNFNTTASLWWMKEHVENGRADPVLTICRGLRAQLSRCHGMKLMASIAPGYEGRILFVPAPLISEVSGEKPEMRIAQEELDLFNRQLARVLEDSGIAYVAQRSETIKDNKWTRSEYWAGSVAGLKAGAPRGQDGRAQYRHMNGRYGAVILAAVRERLRQPARPIS